MDLVYVLLGTMLIVALIHVNLAVALYHIVRPALPRATARHVRLGTRLTLLLFCAMHSHVRLLIALVVTLLTILYA